MKWTNALGTVTAVLTLVLGVMTQLLNCNSTGDLTAVCTSSVLPAQYTGYAAIVFGILTLFLKAVRPGGILNSLFGQTAVVVSDAASKPGVVTTSQVASQ